MPVAFNPNDPIQQQFLSGLALGETGNNSNATFEGFGGIDLSHNPVDQFGFPQWQGGQSGSTHAAGIFQFQPGTWSDLAQKYNLDFSSANDQETGAWYLAQQTYQARTGKDLYGDLAQGNYGSVDQALSAIWPSVMGNAAAPQGLAATLAGGGGANLPFPARPPGLRAWLRRQLDRQSQVDSSPTSKTGSSGSA